MNRRLLVVAAVLVIAGATGIWFLNNFDRVPAREWTGYSGEARRNPFLALQRLAERMGAPARELRSVTLLAELPPGGVLVLPAQRDRITEPDRRRLLEWVAHGGHLVVEAEFFGVGDPLLAALGVARQPIATDRGAKDKPRRPAYSWPGAGAPYAATLFPNPALAHPQATLALAWNGQNALVRFPHGKGRVTAVSSLHFARNPAIGREDHAALAWRVLDADAARPVAIFNRPQKLSLARWLMANAWPALIGLALFVALWLARIVPRFGPVAPDAPPARRRLLDHLLAAGRFQWSAGRAGHLAEAAREAALRGIARAHPEFAAATPRERERYLADALGLSPEDARTVVAGGGVRTQADLIRTIALYQGIHERAGRQ